MQMIEAMRRLDLDVAMSCGWRVRVAESSVLGDEGVTNQIDRETDSLNSLQT